MHIIISQPLHGRALVRGIVSLLEENQIENLCRRGTRLSRMLGYMKHAAPSVLVV